MTNIELSPSDIDCSPLSKSGNLFRTRKARLSGPDKLVFYPGFRAVAFFVLYTCAACFLVHLAINESASHDLTFKNIVGVIISTLFVLAGIVSMWNGVRPVVFDKRKAIYYRKWKTPEVTKNPDKIEQSRKYVLLDDIYSLQILSRLYLRGGYGYQLNLVLKDSSRIYVVGHRDIKQIRRDAKLLSSFIDVPIWESVDLNKNPFQA